MDAFLAMIAYFGFTFAPYGWELCNGQLLSIQQNAALYSLLGVMFGGDSQTTFGLPDLRGRVVLGQGTSSVLPHTNYRMGNATTGVESVTLTTTQMPAHIHTATLTNTSATIKVNSSSGTTGTPGGRSNVLAGSTGGFLYNGTAPDVVLNVGGGTVVGTITIDPAGGATPVSVMQPYCVLNACICTSGLYPQRQ